MEYPEYLDLAIHLIVTSERPGVPLPAAALGNLLRKAAPDVSFRDFDKLSLREVLEDLHTRGRITLTQTDKGAFAVRSIGDGETETPIQAPSYNILRKQIWEAFTFAAPPGRRFLNRLGCSVRSGLSATPSPADEWVEITRITTETQRTWAVEFVKTLKPDIRAAMQLVLQNKDWSGYSFVASLRDQDAQAAREWNKLRSTKVAAHVHEWLVANALPPAWAFQQQSAANPQPRTTSSGSIVPAGELETRDVILAALARLPLSKLLEIPIPSGLILNALSSRKSR